MKIFKLIILLLLFSNVCSAQTYSSVISDVDIKAFINWKFRSEYSHCNLNGLHEDIINWDSSSVIIIDDVDYRFFTPIFSDKNMLRKADSIFSKEDQDFFIAQFSGLKREIKWTKKFLELKVVNKFKNKKTTYQYSIPFFSKNRDYAIIQENWHCAFMFGAMKTSLYRKHEKRGWDFVKAYISLEE